MKPMKTSSARRGGSLKTQLRSVLFFLFALPTLQVKPVRQASHLEKSNLRFLMPASGITLQATCAGDYQAGV